jgi:hypothetical protein
MSEHSQRLYYTEKVIYNHYNETIDLINNHHTKFLRKSTMKYIEDEFSEELHKMRKHRFRSTGYIQYLFLFMNVDNQLHKNIITKKSNNNNDVYVKSFDIFNLKKNDFTTVLHQRPKFACLNSMNHSLKDKFEKCMNIFFVNSHDTKK